MRKTLVTLLCSHHMAEISEELTANQFLINIKKLTKQSEFVDKIQTTSNAIRTHITVTYHRATPPTWWGSLPFNRRGSPNN